ncbi:hypothetical protein ACKI10_17560 [Streptomyces galilaeus]|uniref:Uncharacterized protein n=1 Tax=Streptomyces galilaeus TaxID=33899 RepID=A0ABW9IQE2_STRGJ
MERGQVAIADFLCTHCWTSRRVTGRALVTDYLRSHPIQQHRDLCPARKDNP